ncbi:MAG: hypothetical protein ACRC5R_03065 [Mycoplasmatales bacterium]
MQNINQFSTKYKCKIKFIKGSLYNSLYLNDIEVIKSSLGKNDILLLDSVLISNYHQKILRGEKLCK